MFVNRGTKGAKVESLETAATGSERMACSFSSVRFCNSERVSMDKLFSK